MNTLKITGRLFLGIALTGFAIIQLCTQSFLSDLLPLSSLPLQPFWIYLTSLLLLSCGVMFFQEKYVPLAGLITGGLFFLFFLYSHLPKLITAPRDPTRWTVTFEVLAISSGAFLVGAFHRNQDQAPGEMRMMPAMSLAGRYVFALCLIVFGVQHFMYADFIMTLIPGWIPGPRFWTYIIQFGFLLAAFSLILNTGVSVAMNLLGAMFLLWVLALHAPRALSKVIVASEWSSLCIALALSGISFSIAAAYRLKGNRIDERKDTPSSAELLIRI